MCTSCDLKKLRHPTPRQRVIPSRCGAAALESVIVLSTLFMVLFVIFDLGLAAFRYNALAATARRVAREAVVHGGAAPPDRTAWGSGKYLGTAADVTEIAQSAAPLLATMPPSAVTIQVEWLDGNNQETRGSA